MAGLKAAAVHHAWVAREAGGRSAWRINTQGMLTNSEDDATIHVMTLNRKDFTT